VLTFGTIFGKGNEMGQYYKIVNLDKRKYIKPHDLGDGAKLLEFGMSGGGTMAALAVLLANGNGRGGGDIKTNDPIVGSWAGDKIVIIGDYADPDQFGVEGQLYSVASDSFKNISTKIRHVLQNAGEYHPLWEINENTT